MADRKIKSCSFTHRLEVMDTFFYRILLTLVLLADNVESQGRNKEQTRLLAKCWGYFLFLFVCDDQLQYIAIPCC